MTDTRTQAPPAMRVLRAIVIAGFVMTTIALGAWIWYELADPVQGTTLSDTLGSVAAFSGIAAGISFAGAAIYASIRGLWSHVPPWVRYGVLGYLVVMALYGLAFGGSS